MLEESQVPTRQKNLRAVIANLEAGHESSVGKWVADGKFIKFADWLLEMGLFWTLP